MNGLRRSVCFCGQRHEGQGFGPGLGPRQRAVGAREVNLNRYTFQSYANGKSAVRVAAKEARAARRAFRACFWGVQDLGFVSGV